MVDAVMILTRGIMLTAYLLNVHLIIIPIFHLRFEIEDNFKIIVGSTIVIIMIALLWLSGSELPIGFQTRVFYFLSAIAFIGLIRNVYGVLFGLSFVFFTSEFWEIPIYIYRLTMTNEFTSYSSVSLLFTFVGVLSKLSTILYVFAIMRMYGMGRRRFIKLLGIFTIIYMPLAYIFINVLALFPDYVRLYGWVCRFTCMSFMYGYMLKYYQVT